MTTHTMRCWECPDEVRYRRGCSMGYRQGLGYEDRGQLETTCPVITQEPAGFIASLRLSKWIERGTPAINITDVTHAQLELAEFVQYEISEGQKNYDERKNAAAERMHQMAQTIASRGQK